MSIVGTRPPLVSETKLYSLEIQDCYVQKSTVICAVTEDVNLSWEGW